MSNVVQFPEQGSTNRQCPKCGGEWWIVQAVVIDKDDEGINGYAGIPECHDCAQPEQLRSI